MQDENDVSFIQTVAVSSLPCELVVAGFMDEYEKYIGSHDGTQQSQDFLFFLLLNIVAWLMILVGGLTIIFGPETITYNIRTGPSFTQLVEMYPGPIVSLGGFLLVVTQWFDSNSCSGPLTPEMFLITSYALQLPEGMDPQTPISILHIDGGLFHVTCG